MKHNVSHMNYVTIIIKSVYYTFQLHTPLRSHHIFVEHNKSLFFGIISSDVNIMFALHVTICHTHTKIEWGRRRMGYIDMVIIEISICLNNTCRRKPNECAYILSNEIYYAWSFFSSSLSKMALSSESKSEWKDCEEEKVLHCAEGKWNASGREEKKGSIPTALGNSIILAGVWGKTSYDGVFGASWNVEAMGDECGSDLPQLHLRVSKLS